MGGIGSGRHGGAALVEACRRLDISQLHRAGSLAAGWQGHWHWSDRHGRPRGAISISAGPDRMTLSYCLRRLGEAWQSIVQIVPIIWTPCHFGGRRPWFQCSAGASQIGCGRRAAKLYASGSYFLCRACHRLAYAVEHEGSWDRAYRRLAKSCAKLGAKAHGGRNDPARPKGMHRQTYHRLRERVRLAQRRHDDAYLAVLTSLLKRSGGVPSA